MKNFLLQHGESLQPADSAGFFGPESATWELYREPVFLFGSVRALLLQVAHPAVAEGVARFSNFREDAFGRGKRTFEAMTFLYFGDRQQALDSARKMNAMHRHIQGNYEIMAQGGPATHAYQANDPHLKLWVLATLIDTTILCYETFFKKLLLEEKNRFFEESKIAASLMGIPEDVYPADYESFTSYFQDMLNGGELYVGESGKEICQAVLHHKLAPANLTRLLAVAFLPPQLSDAMGILRKPSDDRRIGNFIKRVRKFYPLIPAPFRYVPAFHQAMGRVAMAENKRPGWVQKWYLWLGRRFSVPLGIPKIENYNVEEQ